MLSLGHSFPRVRTAWFDFPFTYKNIVIDEHDHFEFHTRNIVQNAFYKMKQSGRGSVRSLLTGSDVCYNARRNLVDGSGWITGMQRDWPAARNNRIRDNCESFTERRMAVSPAKISRKTILIPLRVIVAPLSRGISLQFAIYEISICGKGGTAGVV